MTTQLICPRCKSKLREVKVKIDGAKKKVISFQRTKCNYFMFDKKSAQKVIEELKETPLKMKQNRR